MKQIHKVMMIVIAAVFLIYGCSPSSNTFRYKTRNNSQTQVDSNPRFTSQEQSSKSEEVSLLKDSTITNETSVDIDPDDLPDQEPTIDISLIMQKLNTQNNSQNSAVDNSTKERMLMEIIKYLNTPYRYGGTTKDGIDCSAFTQTVFQHTFKVSLLRSAKDQFTQGEEVGDRQELQFGDLVFFNTRKRVRPGHVGVYIGDNLFAHASSKNGVMVSSLDLDYYSRKFMGGRRIEGILDSKL